MTAEVTSGRYQFFSEPDDASYVALRDNIADEGILYPVLVDETGEILDGHQRAKVAAELGVEFPRKVLAGLTEEQKEAAALSANIGTHGGAAEKRYAIREYLLRHPDRSNREVGRLVGCHHSTVGKVKSELARNGEISHYEDRVTPQGKKAPGRKPRSPDQAAIAAAEKRQADLEAGRAKEAERQAKKQAADQPEMDRIRAGVEARGGMLKPKTQPRVVSTQDRIRAALLDCTMALTRALQDPGLDAELVRAEQDLPKDFRIETQRLKLRSLVDELGARLRDLRKQASPHTAGDLPMGSTLSERGF